MNNWKKIWDKRKDNLSSIDSADKEAVLSELKRIDGYDLEGGLPVEQLVRQLDDIKRELDIKSGSTIFEVGSGAGANLYWFAQEGLQVGGLDYSENMLDIMRKVVPANLLRECICDEASNLPTDIKYDAVMSCGVFIYFTDSDYAKRVLSKMLDKSKHGIGVLDVYDEAKKEACMAYRRKTIPNYEERYKDLPKLFLPRELFMEFGRDHDLEVKFTPNNLDKYGNAPFTYNCYLKRRS